MGYRRLSGQVRRGFAPLAALWLALVAGPAAAQEGLPESGCAPVDHAGNRYAVCVIDLRQSDLRLFWQDDAGTPYRSFAAIEIALAAEGAELGVAMNAGMFDADYAPIGLYVEDGATLVDANTNQGYGNFHLLPNGVFYWSGDTAGIMETNLFLAERPLTDYATQSGPMLLIDGEVHPRFLPDSDSFKIRNGVGILDEHRVAFAIAEQPVTFWDFALMFRDALGSRNALYLDGSVSSLRAPELGRPGGGRFGPILAVVE